MKSDLKTLIDGRLSELKFEGTEAVMNALQGKKRHVKHSLKPRLAIILCLIVLLLASAAFALSLRFSHEFNEMAAARALLIQKYGLTDPLLDGLAFSRANNAITFEAQTMNREAIGVYTVKNGAASWSHDGTDVDYESGDLSASVWGPKQLETAIAQRSDNFIANYGSSTLEEKAEIDARAAPGVLSIPHILPEEGDISEQQALAISMDTLRTKYGVTQEALAGYKVSVNLYDYGENGGRQYNIAYGYSTAETIEILYELYILSSGEVKSCLYITPRETRVLPEGDLTPYKEAALEYIDAGAFDILSAADKAALYARLSSAGYADYASSHRLAAPKSGGMSDLQAIDASMGALHRIGFPLTARFLFEPSVSYYHENGQAYWEIIWSPANTLDNWIFARRELLGSYTVTLYENGKPLSVDYSNEGKDGGVYTETSFGTAAAYDVDVLPYIVKLLNSQKAVLNKYEPGIVPSLMNMEDLAYYDGLMRAAGFSSAEFSNCLPKAGELTVEEAVQLARQALVMTRGTTEEWLSSVGVYPSCLLHEAKAKDERAYYCIVFYSMDGTAIGYTVHLNAATGEIEGIWYDSPATGNG